MVGADAPRQGCLSLDGADGILSLAENPVFARRNYGVLCKVRRGSVHLAAARVLK